MAKALEWKKLVPKAQVSRGVWQRTPLGKILKSGPLRMHKMQELEFLNRTQTSLNFGFLFSDSTWILYMYFLNLFLLANSYEPLVVSVSCLNHVIWKNWGNFQRKVGSEVMWNCWWISLAAGPYWKPCIGAILMAKICSNSLKINAPFRLPKIKLLGSLSNGDSNERRKSSKFRLPKQ